MQLKHLLLFVGLSNFGTAILPAEELFPLDAVKAGMIGTGRTVFQGYKVEEFRVEILGVLRNVGPKQSIILAHLSGGPLAETGVIAGMSGSPVYLDGKPVGAVAFTFPFSKKPIAGIRPIQEMIRKDATTLDRSRLREAASAMLFRDGIARKSAEFLGAQMQPYPASVFTTEEGPESIATPVNLAGFSDRTIDVFGAHLSNFGFNLAQGIAGGQPTKDHLDGESLKPGSMISVALILGDLEMSAAGTVTYMEGGRLYAFGHPFMSGGPIELPFSAAEVVTLVPNLRGSFKISRSSSLRGTIIDDHAGGLTGIMGPSPELVPVRVRSSWKHGSEDYSFELIKDRLLTPYLLQMALFSSFDATQRQVGASTLSIQGAAHFEGGLPSLRLDNVFSEPTNTALTAASSTSLMLYYVLLNENVELKGIDIDVETVNREDWAEIDRVWVEKTRVRAGETVGLFVALKSADGEQHVENFQYRVPVGTPTGVQRLTFADAEAVNLMELKSFLGFRRARDPAQLIAAVNRLRRNDQVHIRMWRPEASFRVNAELLPAPPASVATVLSATAFGGSLLQDWNLSPVEVQFSPGLGVIRGNVTTQITIKP